MTGQLQKGCVVSRASWLDNSCLFSCFTSVFTIYADICSRCLCELWPKMFGRPAEIWRLLTYGVREVRFLQVSQTCDLFTGISLPLCLFLPEFVNVWCHILTQVQILQIPVMSLWFLAAFYFILF